MLRDESAFNKDRSRRDGLRCQCRECVAEYYRVHKESIDLRRNQRAHKMGTCQPYNENHSCSQFLGIHVAERVLAKVYPNVERMPMHNPGYDFICGRGYKVDVKSSCLGKQGHWGFRINKNAGADYFLCLGFDNRDDLEPQHIWLIPGEVINHLMGLSICPGERSLSKWRQYEQPLDQVTSCCDVLREEGTGPG